MLRRGFLMGLAVSSGWPALADTGHGEQGIGLTITSVGPDTLDPTKTAVGVQIDNDNSVDVILRSVRTNYGDALMHRTVTVFGSTTRKPIQFLAINGVSTSFLRPPTRQITVDHPFAENAYYAFEFNFGPVGNIFKEIGEP